VLAAPAAAAVLAAAAAAALLLPVLLLLLLLCCCCCVLLLLLCCCMITVGHREHGFDYGHLPLLLRCCAAPRQVICRRRGGRHERLVAAVGMMCQSGWRARQAGVLDRLARSTGWSGRLLG
jgi:hypothetical protein